LNKKWSKILGSKFPRKNTPDEMEIIKNPDLVVDNVQAEDAEGADPLLATAASEPGINVSIWI
jgi:hypothetical protein